MESIRLASATEAPPGGMQPLICARRQANNAKGKAAPIAEGGEFDHFALCGRLLKNMAETTFTLVRTNKSRGGGDVDYDVCDGDKIIGRIVRHPQAPMETPWYWVIIAEGLSPSWLMDRGYAVSREQALERFRARWTGSIRLSDRDEALLSDVRNTLDEIDSAPPSFISAHRKLAV